MPLDDLRGEVLQANSSSQGGAETFEVRSLGHGEIVFLGREEEEEVRHDEKRRVEGKINIYKRGFRK